MSAHWEKGDVDEFPLGSREYRDPATMVEQLALAAGRARAKRLRDAIEQRPPEEVIPLLAAELSECTDARRFDRVARTLARVGGPEAVDVLARHARTQRRFPGFAIHALSHCADERVCPLLIDLAEFGRHAQRVSSIRALGRLKEVRSVETLCRIARNGRDSMRPYAHAALRRKGGFNEIAHGVLSSGDFDTAMRLRYLLAMENTPTGWRKFSAEKLLERILKKPQHPLKPEARSTLDLLRAQATLLRASPDAGDSLLRAAGGTRDSDPSSLLRASDGLPHPPSSAYGSRYWLLALIGVVRRLFHRA